jgi:hypothetical protein
MYLLNFIIIDQYYFIEFENKIKKHFSKASFPVFENKNNYCERQELNVN